MSVGELEASRDTQPGGTAVYVYGVVRADEAPGGRVGGVGGQPVEALRSGALAALVAEVTTPIRAKRRELLGHAAVVDDAAATTTIVPLRFGTTFPSAEAVVEELLEPRRAELERLLTGLDGKVELLVKAFYREEAILGEIVRGDARIARLSAATRERPAAATHAQRLELGTAVAAALEARTRADAHAFLAELQPLAHDLRVNETPVEHQVLRASLLVERRRVPDVDVVMNQLAERQAGRIEFTYAGPLAPHSFVDLEGARWVS